MFISNFRGGSGGLGGVFSSKLAPVDCKTDRKIDGELLEYGVKIPQKMAANGLRETRKLVINRPDISKTHVSSGGAFGGPGGGFGGLGGGFLFSSLSSGFATTFTTT